MKDPKYKGGLQGSKVEMDKERDAATDFICCDSYTQVIQPAVVEIVDSETYSIKVGTSWIQMSRKHLMDTIRDMDERRTYEKRLADLELKVAYCKSGYSKDVSDPIVKEAKDLSDDIDSYVEARGEDLEEELEEPIIEVRMTLADLGYPISDEDAEMAKYIRECNTKHAERNAVEDIDDESLNRRD
jgi:hypothetical protein